jgi:hypothetical protein
MALLRIYGSDAPGGCLLRLLAGLFPFVALAGILAMVRLYGLGWGPRHHISEPVAQLGPNVLRAIAEQSQDVEDFHDAETGALHITASLLHFGFRHRTDLRFDQPRQANSNEYAALFGVVFNQLAVAAKLNARARVVRSEPTSFMGFVPSHPAFRGHHWVAIQDGDDRRYLDPTLHDAWLGTDISRNVQGSPEAARRRDPVARPTAHRPERVQSSLPPPSKPRGVLGIVDRIGESLSTTH